MTIGSLDVDLDDGPRYLAIADAIERAVESGALADGARLPTHRELSVALGVTVGTVTRGYAEAERRGLTVGEVGRGTFVRSSRDAEGYGWRSPHPEEGVGVVDMSLACPWIPPDGEDGRELRRALEDIARDGPLDELLAYHPHSALPRHRAAAAAWIRSMGLDVSPDRVVVTAGAQHAMTVILSTLLRPGDTLLTAELTYPGIKAVAQILGMRLRGVALDERGMVPEDLERAAVDTNASALYCVPTLQNPTGATMNEERRRAVADVARRRGLIVVEDDIHFGVGGQDGPALASLAPERTCHLTTLSKGAAFGLRVAFIAAPARAVERLRAGVRSTLWMPAPLMTEVATRWIADGTAARLAARKRSELEARLAIAQDVLGSHGVRARPHALHFWLRLPDPWRSEEFVDQARQRGVLVAGAEAFAVGRREAPHAVRVSVAQVPYREDVRRGLEILADLLSGRSDPCVDIL